MFLFVYYLVRFPTTEIDPFAFIECNVERLSSSGNKIQIFNFFTSFKLNILYYTYIVLV